MPRTKNTRAGNNDGAVEKFTRSYKDKIYTYWRVRITVIDPLTGIGKQKTIGTYKTQKEALKAKREALSKTDTGTYTDPSKMTVKTWLISWLSEYVKPSVKPLTYSTYESRIKNHIVPVIGSVKLTALNSIQLQKFSNSLTEEKKLAPKTVISIIAILSEALSKAVELKLIPFNPADSINLPKMKQKEISPLNDKQIVDFISEIEKGEPFERLFKVTLFTGMREGEVCGLSWEAVDFKKGTITVKQQLQKEKEKGGRYYIAPTKNGEERTITPPPYVMKLLKEQKIEQQKDRLAAADMWNNKFNLVFTYPDGSFIPLQTVYKHFKKIAEKIGRPDACVHDLRHTYATISIGEGVDIKTVSENLGHATVAFTLDKYGHVSDQMNKEHAEKIENYIDKIKA